MNDNIEMKYDVENDDGIEMISDAAAEYYISQGIKVVAITSYGIEKRLYRMLGAYLGTPLAPTEQPKKARKPRKKASSPVRSFVINRHYKSILDGKIGAYYPTLPDFLDALRQETGDLGGGEKKVTFNRGYFQERLMIWYKIPKPKACSLICNLINMRVLIRDMSGDK